MTGDRPGVSKHRKQFIVFRYKLEHDAHERFWRFLNPNTPNAEGKQERILEKLSVVLSGDYNKTIAQNYNIAVVKNGKKKGVEKSVKQFYQYAYFVHYYVHK
jgi:hypothetical protein